MNLRHFAFALAIATALLTGCSTYRGVAEFTAYRSAFQTAQAGSEAILDRLAVAERSIYPHKKPFDPTTSSFDPDDAAYIVTAGDPPGTAAYRRTLRAVGAYTEVLYGLTSGQTAEAMAAQIGQLAAIGASAAAVVTPAGAAGSFLGSVQTINAAIGALAPVTVQLAGFGTRAKFREELLGKKDVLLTALTETRRNTRLMFNDLRDQIVLSASPGTITAAEEKQILSIREIIANWVIMLDVAIESFNRAVKAAADENAGTTSGLIQTSQSMIEASQAARRALATLP